MTNDREAGEQTLDITRRPHILETRNLPLMCVVYGLTKDLYLRIVRCKMKTLTLLMSYQRVNAIKDPSYLTRCMQGWDLKHLAKIGCTRPRHMEHTPIPQPYPTHRVISYTNHYDESGKIQRMKPPPGSISRQLDDMLSTSFSYCIINYKPPRGFLV